MADTWTDWAVKRDHEGCYDLDVDATGRDLAVTQGFDTALGCSLFTDRRAAPDEVADPWKRRGWIGNLTAKWPGDNFGSGLWLYEQSRATDSVRAAVRMEAIQSLDWLVDGQLVQFVDGRAAYDPVKRRLTLTITITDKLGGVSERAFPIWQRTGAKTIGTNQ